jgi:hypothetical protein
LNVPNAFTYLNYTSHLLKFSCQVPTKAREGEGERETIGKAVGVLIAEAPK